MKNLFIFAPTVMQNEKMTTDRSLMRRYAMLLGTYMGVFWILKFALFPIGMRGSSFLLLLFLVLTCVVPFMGYKYAKLYRDQACGGSIGFGRACWFLVQMYLFASLLTAVAHYIYFAFIDRGAMVDMLSASWELTLESGAPGVGIYADAMEEALTELRALSAVDIMFQLLCQNVFFCIVLSVITALAVKRDKIGNEEK